MVDNNREHIAYVYTAASSLLENNIEMQMDIDTISQSLIPPDLYQLINVPQTTRFITLKSEGNGNCFYNAVSKLYGG